MNTVQFTPRAVVFDFDGTIVDTETPPFLCIQREYARFGLKLTREAWQHRLGRTDLRHWTVELEEAVGQPLDREEIRVRVLSAKNRLTEDQPVRPGIVGLIDRCKQFGLPLAVASSSAAEWVHPNLRARGLFDAFDAIVTRDAAIPSKPAPDSYLRACELLAVNPVDALAIEDSHNGLLAARSAGLDCVIVPNPMTANMTFAGAAAVVSTAAEIELTIRR
ncbi:MAG: HAD-IA family hydrolase [Actinobacteria bacterium]|nr:HAD-IA family hydrolase [Actinomycetota bacterium]